MRLALLLICLPALAQNRPVREIPSQVAGTVGLAYVRENYTKYEYKIPMRDGVKLFTSVYIPKDVASDGHTYPIMMTRTPYSVRPYGVDQYPTSLGPSEFFAREKFIFVYQDVRGRNMSEGNYVTIRPYNPRKKGKDTDESSDTYDAIDWLVKNVPGNSGKVGVWGISQPGFYATAALLDPHPALIAVSPQAPVTDYYIG
jgi:putative CocE/NonD family hydrolase